MPTPASAVRLPRSAGELVYTLTVAGLIAGVLLSLPLWSTERAFPHLPVLAIARPWPAPIDAILLWLTLGVLAASVLLPGKRFLTIVGIAGCLVLGLQDQVRWQPWFFQYIVMLAACVIAGGRESGGYLLVCRILVICLYAWGGIHKFNPGYANLCDSTFIDPLSKSWPAWAAGIVRTAMPFGPWMEVAAAAALCFPRSRRAGVILIAAVHITVLLMIGPAGTKTNHVVWPWNLVMPAITVLLFWQCQALGWKSLTGARDRAAAVAVGVICGALPALSLGERWDRYLSFQLYSGTDRRMVVVVDGPAAAALPAAWQQFLTDSPHTPGLKELRFLDWSLAELGAPCPGDQRHLLALARKCAAMDFTRQGNVLFYTDFAFLVKERGWDTFSPEEIRRLTEIPTLRNKY